MDNKRFRFGTGYIKMVDEVGDYEIAFYKTKNSHTESHKSLIMNLKKSISKNRGVLEYLGIVVCLKPSFLASMLSALFCK